jgi:16S rRNA (cytidine1402-2'-O)-methyltransferase
MSLIIEKKNKIKKFEENKHGTLKEVHAHFAAKTIKGEIVIVVEGKTKEKNELRVESEED